jgi:peptidoglycan/xylan/chitin deacetylase (PgdA/CDA1 family)
VTDPSSTDPAILGRRSILLLGAAAALSACSPSSGSVAASDTPAASRTPSPSPTRSSTSPAASPSATTTSAGAHAVEVVHGPRTTPAVALTFHGAGDPAIADRVLGSAEKAGAVLTIMAVGTWLAANPHVADRILSGGHELGNHTLHHRPMRLMHESAAYAEIVGGQSEVLRFSANPSWFRPSGTPHASRAILAAAGRAGYRTSLSFDVDPADYTDPGASVVTARVLAAVRPGSIVSLHLGHAGTVAALPHILDGLAARGLSPVSVSTLLPGVAP